MKILVQITTWPDNHPENAELIREFVLENNNYDNPSSLAIDAQQYLGDMANIKDLRLWATKKWRAEWNK
jgi:hypothetical protein